MDYVLMNKNKPLCRLSIDMENYVIDDILEVFNQKAFPVGVDFIGGYRAAVSVRQVLSAGMRLNWLLCLLKITV